LLPRGCVLHRGGACVDVLVALSGRAREERLAVGTLLRRSRQTQQRIRLTNAGDSQPGQDPVSGHTLRLNTGQARDEGVQRHRRIVFPGGRDLLPGHPAHLGERLDILAPDVTFLTLTLLIYSHADTAHSCSIATSLYRR